MNKSLPIYKIIENQIYNNHLAESFFASLLNLGLDARIIESRFRFDLYPVCEFFSIPPGSDLGRSDRKFFLNWELITSCSILIGFLYPKTHVENLLSFLQHLQKVFSKGSTSKKEGASMISHEFFELFPFGDIKERIALSSNPLIANDYKNEILSYLELNKISTHKKG